MRYFITGIRGQLGHDIYEELVKRYGTIDNEYIIPTSDELDITDEEKVNELIAETKPDIIYHCAAYTAVDKAEEDTKTCYDVNVIGTKNIVNAARKVSSKVVFISTDYVFDGTKGLPYQVTDEVKPANFYGKTKHLAEEIVKEYQKSFIIRTSWVFGINGKNFVKTMLKLAETKNELGVVSDQIGSPTYTRDLANTTIDISESNRYGVYHVTNEGYTSWNQFARFIFASNGIDIKVNEVLSENYKTLAKRPLDSRLDKKALIENGFNLLPTWQDAIIRYNEELKLTQEKVKKLEKSEK